ncbi:MAG: heat shock protein HtpX [Myxococcota bacterium]|jgi:heat shock protein HtpX
MLNTLKTTALLAFLTSILVAIGYGFGGSAGMIVMLGVSVIINFGTWFFADTIVIKTTGAVPVDRNQLGWLHDEVEDLAQRANMPVPRLYIVPHEQSPNAFATGRSPSRGVVAVTAGLLQTLSRREVRGVLAHELGHIKNRDTLVSAIAATMAGVISFAARITMFSGGRRNRNPLLGIVIMIAAPLAAVVLRMMISRTREYGADARAAQITGDPEGLAMALEGLSRGTSRRPMQTQGAQNVHFIVNGFGGRMGRLLSTHPPTEKRVAKLRDMARRS